MYRKPTPLLLLPSPPPSSPVTGKQSPPPNFLYTITSFIRSEQYRDGSADLVISPVDIQLFHREIQQPVILSDSEAKSLRYDYSPEADALTIKAMPGSLHNVVANASTELLEDMRDIGFLSRSERKWIVTDTGTDVELPTIRSLSDDGGKSKSGTACKQPDAAFYFIDRTTSPWRRDIFPRVVFEVGLSQKRATLIHDAKDWLVRSQGLVKVVVVINMDEGPIPAQSTVTTDVQGDNVPEPEEAGSVTVDTADNDANDAGDSVAISDTADDLAPVGPVEAIPPGPSSPTTSQSSTAQEYADDLLRDPPTMWVGPISGTIALYRYDPNSGTARRESPEHNLFEQSATSPAPKLRISDLLPASCIEGDPTREFVLPLATYREYIAAGILNMAATRHARHRKAARKRFREEDSSGEYHPLSQESRQKRRA